MIHFSEILKERENISVSEAIIRNIFTENDVLSVKACRKTKQALKKKLATMKKLSLKQKDQLIQLETEEFTGMVHPTQPRCKYFGGELAITSFSKIMTI